MPTKNAERKTLEIRKYQNRRYYDTTNSRHLSLQDIYKLIVGGDDVRIVDAQSGRDITAKILIQIMLDYEPLKLEVFSNELLTQAIRVNDTLLKEFVDLYFRQAFEAFCGSQRRFKSMLREAHQLTSTLARPATWMGGIFPGWGAPDELAETAAKHKADTVSLRAEIEKLHEEMGEVKAQLSQGQPRRGRVPKA